MTKDFFFQCQTFDFQLSYFILFFFHFNAISHYSGSPQANTFSFSISNHLNRPITIQQSTNYKTKFSTVIPSSSRNHFIQFKDERDETEITLIAMDTLTQIRVDINGQSSLKIRITTRVYVLDVAPRGKCEQ